MSEALFLDLLKETMFLVLIMSAPILLVAMIVGVAISLLQAVTQIQESTLTFVPKILACVSALIVASPWMLHLFVDHTQRLLKSMTEITH